MAGHTTSNTQYLTRNNIWSSQIKEMFEDELSGINYVKMLSDFPDGDTINIPSIGQAEAYDYAEDQGIRYSAIDTGNYTFSITKYKAAGISVSNKFKQDSFYANQLMSEFVPGMQRAIMVEMEKNLMAVAPDAQTASNVNLINGGRHRFVASGASETIAIEDFQRARYALRKANVPMTNLVAIVDPSVTHALGSLAGINNLSFNPRWEGIVSSGATTGMKFVMSVHGFDVYESNYLKVNSGSETIDSVTAAAGVNNMFFSAAPEAMPFVGAVRQAPTVESSYNKDYQREEHVITARWGFGLFRPENMVIVLTDTDQVYA